MIDNLMTGGGAVSLAAVLAWSARQLFLSRRESKSGPVADVAAANAALLASLAEEREEVVRLSGRVQELENQNAMLYERFRETRAKYEREIAGLRSQVDSFRQQLDTLQQQLRSDHP